MPKKQPKRGRLWLKNVSCVHLCLKYKDLVWSYDFMIEHKIDGKAFKILNIVDKHTHECLANLMSR